jgi:hypothetical protein
MYVHLTSSFLPATLMKRIISRCRKLLVNSRESSHFVLAPTSPSLTFSTILFPHSTVAEKVILSRSSVISKFGALSVDGVNEILDEISKTVPTIGPNGKKKMPSYVRVSDSTKLSLYGAHSSLESLTVNNTQKSSRNVSAL